MKNFRKILIKYKYWFKYNLIRIFHKLQGKQYIHLLHISKTGGTAIKHALKPHLVSDRYVIKLHSHGMKLKDIPTGDYVVFFLRDPVDRFVSSFYSRQRQGQPCYFRPWKQNEKVAFKDFNNPQELAATIFSENEEKKKKALRAMRSIQHVKSSYWEWFESESYFLSRLSDIFFIGFQENLSEDFELLKSKLELSQNVELPTDNVYAHRNPHYLNKKLTEEAKEDLKKWYAKDYEFINLCKEIIKQGKDNQTTYLPLSSVLGRANQL